MISKIKAISKFESNLKGINNPTIVRRVRSFNLKKLDSFRNALSIVNKGDIIWQHNEDFHVVGMYIMKGDSHKFSRNIIDLIASGITTTDEFIKLWDASNNNSQYGYIPKVKISVTNEERMKQKSFIVYDKSKGYKSTSNIKGFSGIPHRTHLIPVQITGIEKHEGLLIDFDGWLNSVDINHFEKIVLEISEEMDIIWKNEVFIEDGNLHFKNTIFSQCYEILAQKEWVDDRWYYWWSND